MDNQDHLITACQTGNIEEVKNCLLSYEIDFNQGWNVGMDALHHACYNGHIGIVKVLLQSGEIYINATNNSGVTPL